MARKTTEQKIADLEAKIQSLKAKAERKKIAKNPVIKPLNAALAYLDKALNATSDAVLREPLDEARATVSSCLRLLGVTPKTKRGGRRLLTSRARGEAASTDNAQVDGQPDADDLLKFLAGNPGSSSETLSKEFSTDSATLRPVMRQLIDEGKVKVKGQKRGTRYSASV